MIRIELVNIDGRLVGRTASDRWNLAMLECDDMVASRYNTDIQRARRMNPDFSFVVIKGEGTVSATNREIDALGTGLALIAA